MMTTESQLGQAKVCLEEQRADYARNGVPIVFSPKALVLTLNGADPNLRRAGKAISPASQSACGVGLYPDLPYDPRPSSTLRLLVPFLHFDFEEAESNVVRLLAEIIATREKVNLVDVTLLDMLQRQDTVSPIDIPTNWNSCVIPIPVRGVENSSWAFPGQTGFTIKSTSTATIVDRLEADRLDPRLPRVKLWELISSIINGTKPMRGDNLLDIRFTTKP